MLLMPATNYSSKGRITLDYPDSSMAKWETSKSSPKLCDKLLLDNAQKLNFGLLC